MVAESSAIGGWKGVVDRMWAVAHFFAFGAKLWRKGGVGGKSCAPSIKARVKENGGFAAEGIDLVGGWGCDRHCALPSNPTNDDAVHLLP